MKPIVILIFISSILGCYSKSAELTGLEGKQLPSFKLLLSDSVTNFDTKNIPNGNPIVLLFYSPRCPYSRAQMKEIIDNISILKHIRFYILTAASLEEMNKFSVTYELNKYSNITAGCDYTYFFEEYFKVMGVPYIAVYGKDKKLNKAFKGKINSKEILKALN